MIFPGMDPWVEHPAYWPGFHNGLVYNLVALLNPLLGSRYVARLDARLYIQGPAERDRVPDVLIERFGPAHAPSSNGVAAIVEPDSAVTVSVPGWEMNESVIAIVDRAREFKVVTWIEVVSLSNKYAGEGRSQYLTKQREILASDAHLVEIDLLRAGPHVLAVPEWAVRPRFTFDYLISINRASGCRETFQLFPRTVRDRLPVIGIPLLNGDADVAIDLRAAAERTYHDGRYRNVIDYTKPCEPRLSAKDRAWANNILKTAGLK